MPLVDDDGHLQGMYLFSDLKRIKSGDSAIFNLDPRGRLCVAAAVGTGSAELQRVERLAHQADGIVIDTAHGDSLAVFETLREIKRRYDIQVVVGNVSEGESARRLVDAGADGIKVGQGSGSICTTRIVAGIGCPQVTAIYSVAQAIEGSGVPICADGGIEHSGDITIALGAGADSVMLGKLLAGVKEANAQMYFKKSDRPMRVYRGMGSLESLRASEASRNRYQQSEDAQSEPVPEGVEGAVPYGGELATIMHQYLGGLRKGMGYVGAATIEELHARANFYRISAAGIRESHVHGVEVLNYPSNYTAR